MPALSNSLVVLVKEPFNRFTESVDEFKGRKYVSAPEFPAGNATTSRLRDSELFELVRSSCAEVILSRMK